VAAVSRTTLEAFENLAETLAIFVTLLSIHLPSGGLHGIGREVKNHRFAIHDEQGRQIGW
jgi:hypothetical protein